jgi:hypothetical protein
MGSKGLAALEAYCRDLLNAGGTGVLVVYGNRLFHGLEGDLPDLLACYASIVQCDHLARTSMLSIEAIPMRQWPDYCVRRVTTSLANDRRIVSYMAELESVIDRGIAARRALTLIELLAARGARQPSPNPLASAPLQPATQGWDAVFRRGRVDAPRVV